jgi:uncharacterized damage-inducible protein DinB/predicted enzyme related to lactoylglutathione lyase
MFCTSTRINRERDVYARIVHVVARPLGVVFDCANPDALAAFWQGMLGGEIDPRTKTDIWVGLGPIEGYGSLGFQKVPEGKGAKNRVHLDLDVDDLETAVQRARTLGARSVGEVVEEQTNWFQVMLDVEDNEFCFILRKNRAPEDRVIDDVGRPEPPVGSGEIETLLGFLDYQRSTLEWKTRGLDATGLAQRVSPSSMTLGGILKHLAWVEDHWFSYFLFNVDRSEPWRSVDWSADQNWEWNSASSDSPEDLRALWTAACGRSRENVRSVISAGLGQHAVRTWPNGESPSLRWIVVHMIEEYARHNGHADYLRESVDGETGE